MPNLVIYSCSNCDFSLGSWESIIYVIKDNGERVICPHPFEYLHASIILIQDGHPLGCLSPGAFDKNPTFIGGNTKAYNIVENELTIEEKMFVRSRTGSMTDCICLDCLINSKFDIARDIRLCNKCGSKNVKTLLEMIGQTCPKCHSGIIEKRDSGIIS